MIGNSDRLALLAPAFLFGPAAVFEDSADAGQDPSAHAAGTTQSRVWV